MYEIILENQVTRFNNETSTRTLERLFVAALHGRSLSGAAKDYAYFIDELFDAVLKVCVGFTDLCETVHHVHGFGVLPDMNRKNGQFFHRQLDHRVRYRQELLAAKEAFATTISDVAGKTTQKRFYVDSANFELKKDDGTLQTFFLRQNNNEMLLMQWVKIDGMISSETYFSNLHNTRQSTRKKRPKSLELDGDHLLLKKRRVVVCEFEKSTPLYQYKAVQVYCAYEPGITFELLKNAPR